MLEPCLDSRQQHSRLLLTLLALSLCSQTANAIWLPFVGRLGHSSLNSNRARDDAVAHLHQKRDFGFFDPSRQDGGSMLTAVPNTYPEGLGEPINLIITANSDSEVLEDREDQGGLRNYFLSLGFSSECLGQSLGSKQAANLGDGNGYLNETAVIRWNYGDPYVGSCKETIQGGNHFRYWKQNGPNANSGAIFMAASYELPISLGHDIHPNGYNVARDWVVGNATGFAWPEPNPLQFVPTPDQIASTSLLSVASVASTFSIASVAAMSSLSMQAMTTAGQTQSTVPVYLPSGTPTESVVIPSVTPPVTRRRRGLTAAGATGNLAIVPNGQVTGTTSANNWTYQTTATYITGLLGNTSEGINHYLSVPADGLAAVDGLVAVLVVKIISRPDGTSAAIKISIPAMVSLLVGVALSSLLLVVI